MASPVRQGQEVRIIPTTAWGKWACGFAVGFIVLFVVFFVFMLTGPRGETTFTFTPDLIPGLLAVASAVAALVTGLFAIVLRGERSILAFAATAIGFAATFMVVGEFFIPPFD